MLKVTCSHLVTKLKATFKFSDFNFFKERKKIFLKLVLWQSHTCLHCTPTIGFSSPVLTYPLSALSTSPTPCVPFPKFLSFCFVMWSADFDQSICSSSDVELSGGAWCDHQWGSNLRQPVPSPLVHHFSMLSRHSLHQLLLLSTFCLLFLI